MPTLTDAEVKEINDILDAVEDHPGFVNGKDVAKIAEIMLRLFTPAKPEAKKSPAKKSPAKKEASE